MHYLFRHLMNNKRVAVWKLQGCSLRDPSLGDRQGLQQGVAEELWDTGRWPWPGQRFGNGGVLNPLPPQTTLGLWEDSTIPQESPLREAWNGLGCGVFEGVLNGLGMGPLSCFTLCGLFFV